jgi:membrane protease YdiL (CAAX protease family)
MILPSLCLILLKSHGVKIDPVLFSAVWDIGEILLFSFLYFKVMKKSLFSDFKPMPWFWILFVCSICLCWFDTELLAWYVIKNISNYGYDTYSTMVANNTGLYVFVALILAPLSEELFFRGILYSVWRYSFRPVVCALCTSVLFAVSHGTVMHLPLAFIFGMFSAWLYEMTGSLLYSMLAHMLSNFISFGTIIVLPNFVVTTPIFIILVLFSVSVLFLLWRYMKPIREYLTTEHLLDRLNRKE